MMMRIRILIIDDYDDDNNDDHDDDNNDDHDDSPQ